MCGSPGSGHLPFVRYIQKKDYERLICFRNIAFWLIPFGIVVSDEGGSCGPLRFLLVVMIPHEYFIDQPGKRVCLRSFSDCQTIFPPLHGNASLRHDYLNTAKRKRYGFKDQIERASCRERV